jgi:hypothetical protein
MPNRRLATGDVLGYLGNRSTLCDQALEVSAVERSSPGALGLVHSLQPVFLDPVADRGFMQADAPANLGERETLVERPFQ